MKTPLRFVLLVLLSINVAHAVDAPTAAAIKSEEKPATKADSVYLFAFFRNEKDGLHLAKSTDGLHWDALYQDKIVLAPKVGGKLMRDPTLQRGPDGTFHLVWTDSWSGQSIGYANSKDLLHWSDEQELPLMASEPTTKMTWAPEIRYDSAKEEWLLYWSSTVGTTTGQRTYSTTTKDFKTFSPAKLFFDPGFGEIDASILADNGKYLMFYKHGGQGIQIASADNLQGPFKDTGEMFAYAGKDEWEAPWPAKIGDDYFLYADKFHTKDRMGLWRSHDLKTWEDITTQTSGLRGMEHGSIIQVPPSIIAAIEAATPASVPAPAPAPAASSPSAIPAPPASVAQP